MPLIMISLPSIDDSFGRIRTASTRMAQRRPRSPYQEFTTNRASMRASQCLYHVTGAFRPTAGRSEKEEKYCDGDHSGSTGPDPRDIHDRHAGYRTGMDQKLFRGSGTSPFARNPACRLREGPAGPSRTDQVAADEHQRASDLHAGAG